MKPTELTSHLLGEHPLPDIAAGGDKEDRGHVLVVAGCREIPGAAVLAATAALRAGAGKLTIATAASVAAGIAFAVPESRTIALAESPDGAIARLDDGAITTLSALRGKVDAILVGPGMQDEAACCAIARGLADTCPATPLILDAYAMSAVRQARPADMPLLTPHAGEMSHLTGQSKEDIQADPVQAALQGACEWNAIVILKGAQTVVASPDGQCWLHTVDNSGLATSGSGDVLAGILCGLTARGLPLLSAALWGVVLHARAGARLSSKHGRLGYLARDISAEITGALSDLDETTAT